MTSVHLPIFPLPELTFFPHTLLPLHVFEARYRAMVTDALARDRRLVVVGLRPGHEAEYAGRPPVFAVGGAGEIVRWERLATGRFNILLRGDRRVRIDGEIPTDTLYRMVRAMPLAEAGDDRAGVPALVERVRDRCRQILAAVGRAAAGAEASLSSAGPPGALCDRIASAVIPSPGLRQSLLEELDVERRLERLAEALDGLLRRLTGGR